MYKYMGCEKWKLGMYGIVIISKLYTIYNTTSSISFMWHQEYHGNTHEWLKFDGLNKETVNV